MASRFTELVVDCADPAALARFWCEVLGYRVVGEEEAEVEIAGWAADADAIRRAPTPPTLLFVKVPDGRAVKNRLHLDLTPVDRSRDEEVGRLLALGARHADVGQGKQRWTVLADPEGNEFCVLRSLEERGV